MPNVLLIVVATLALALPSAAQERTVEPLARQVTSNLTLKLPVGSCTVPQLAAHIASQLDIPSGIELLPGPCTSPDQPLADEIPLMGMTFKDVLDLLIKADSRYYGVYSDGVVVVRPLEAWKKRDHFLHDTLQSLELKEQNIGAAMDQIFARHGRIGGSGELHMSNDPALVTLSLGPVSRIEALDAVVRAHGRIRWEVVYCLPEVESDVATARLYVYDEGVARPRSGLGVRGPFAREGSNRTVNRCPTRKLLRRLQAPEHDVAGAVGSGAWDLGLGIYSALSLFTTPAPSSPSSLVRIKRDDRFTSRAQCPSTAFTCNTPSSSSRTVVTRSIPEPTAARHANSTFSGQSGALRITSASTAGMRRSARIKRSPPAQGARAPRCLKCLKCLRCLRCLGCIDCLRCGGSAHEHPHMRHFRHIRHHRHAIAYRDSVTL